jgi:phosphoribosylamine--glycine ligase
MRVLVVGGGGREHALAWTLRRSRLVDDLMVAPGNAGVRSIARRFAVSADDVDAIVGLAEREDADLTVVGPEAPLVAGLADALETRGRRVFGPSAAGARLEGSKAFAKDLMRRHGIPTARSGTFTDVGDAAAFVDELGGRAVVKADGLAAGKGVTVVSDRASAIAALEDSLARGAFGAAGSTVVVEEVLEGPEVSAFALLDGERVVPLGLAQDFKRIGEGDTGPNTGGMGAYAPLPWLDAGSERRIWTEAVHATARALRDEGIAYRGCLFAGLMLTEDGPKVLEFNCRFGDPETEVLLPRLGIDLGEALSACADGRLPDLGPGDEQGSAAVGERAAVAVVLASGGYPGHYETGKEIRGLEAAAEVDDVTVFHAGTEDRDGRVVTAGGRVLAVSALGASLREARARANEACGRISFDGMTYRRDIAERAAEGEETA